MSRAPIYPISRATQRVDIFNIQERKNHSASKPWVVRWRVEGKFRSRSFRTRTEANRYRGQLTVAVTTGEPFNVDTGEPCSWGGEAPIATVFEWSRRWLAEQWPEWQPRTRYSAIEALGRFIPLAVSPKAPPPPPGMRRHLAKAVRPDFVEDDGDADSTAWLQEWSMDLGELDKSFLAEVDRLLGVGDAGQQLAPATANRVRRNARACIGRAVELDLLAVDPWPAPPKGRSRRKAIRGSKRLDLRCLPDPETMARIIEAIPNNYQPISVTYQAMTAVAYFGGLRPSEVVMIRRRALSLPEDDWGRIDVLEADIDNDTPGDPKTGQRRVPIPPVLVSLLQAFLTDRPLGDDDLIFRTRTGRMPTPGSWARTFHLALDRVGHPRLRVYDCRHAAATTWLQAGVPLGEVARRLGHSVETLVSVYVGALTGGEAVANQRIDEILGGLSLGGLGRRE